MNHNQVHWSQSNLCSREVLWLTVIWAGLESGIQTTVNGACQMNTGRSLMQTSFEAHTALLCGKMFLKQSMPAQMWSDTNHKEEHTITEVERDNAGLGKS